ncbi:MAG: hypothetical protein IPJ37_13905 [Bacteroidales bacterium]|nr:hypothetical protein [Bacteroidales bacterium]
MSLAYAIAKELSFNDFNYAVICPEKNVKLSQHGKVFQEFQRLLKDPDKLKIIYLDDIKNAFEKIENDFQDQTWPKEFINRYCD